MMFPFAVPLSALDYYKQTNKQTNQKVRVFAINHFFVYTFVFFCLATYMLATSGSNFILAATYCPLNNFPRLSCNIFKASSSEPKVIYHIFAYSFLRSLTGGDLRSVRN